MPSLLSPVAESEDFPPNLPQRKQRSANRSISATGEIVSHYHHEHVGEVSSESIREELQHFARNGARSHKFEEISEENSTREGRQTLRSSERQKKASRSHSPRRSNPQGGRSSDTPLQSHRTKISRNSDKSLPSHHRRLHFSDEASSLKTTSSHSNVKGKNRRSLSPKYQRPASSEDLRKAKEVANRLQGSSSHDKRRNHHTHAKTKGRNHRSLSPKYQRPTNSEDLRKAKEVANSLRSASSQHERRNHHTRAKTKGKNHRSLSPKYQRPANSEDLRKAKEVASRLQSSSSHHHKTRKGKNHRSLSPSRPRLDRRPASSEDLRKAKDVATSLRSSSSHHHKKRKQNNAARTAKENQYYWSLPPNYQQHHNQAASPEQLRRAKEVANGLRSPTSLNDDRRNELLEKRKKAREKKNEIFLSQSLHRHQTTRKARMAVKRHHRSLSPVRRGAENEYRITGSEQQAYESSEEEEMPGAYRVGSRTTSRVESTQASLPTHSGHSLALSDEESETHSFRSFASDSSHEPTASNGETLVDAEIARDMTEEIEAAREQGRAEALVQASNQDDNIVVAVAEPREEKEDNDSLTIGRRKGILFALCWCLVVVIGVVGYVVVTRQSDNDLAAGTTSAEDGAELDATFRYDPPTAEDCASIANGTDVVDQEDMFSLFVDMHIQIESENEEDTVFLVGLLQQQIQLKVIPLLVGCDGSAGNVIGNGVVESATSNETSTCLFQNQLLCLEVVFTLKIYLRREEDGSTVLKIMSEIVYEEDLNETLELPQTVQTAGVSQIVIREAPPPIPSDLPSPIPSGLPSLTPSDTTSRVPTRAPTDLPSVNPTNAPFPGPSPPPTSNPTKVTTTSPSDTPSKRPSVKPSSTPSFLPSEARTGQPSVAASNVPSAKPSVVPSSVPSETPTRQPSALPSTKPSYQPTMQGVPVTADWDNLLVGGDIGRYFLFRPEDWEAAFGSLPPPDTRHTVEADVWRSGAIVYSGQIRMWVLYGSDPDIGIPDGFEHGRRHPSWANGDWETGDLIVPR